ncbi:MAG: flagellar biosynthetic protein FliR [Lachnospiraceae bacterium]|nr:flagellar biosynthetic protein FliR [Lachnospiraceae bacterium]
MIDYTFSMYEMEFYLLIFVRVTCFIFTAPFFSLNNTPKRVKVVLGIFVAYLLYGNVVPHERLVYETVLEYAFIVMKEAVAGLTIGLSAGICNSIVLFAGRLTDMEIGLAMASEYDPTTRESTSVSGLFYQYIVLMMLVVTDMHHFLLRALAETFTLIPVNGAVLNGDRLLKSIVSFMSDYITIGFKICLPIFCALLITNCILGIMAKVAPQMNMFAVGMQIKLLMGLGIMFFTAGMLPYVSDYIYTEMKTMMVSFVEAMMA